MYPNSLTDLTEIWNHDLWSDDASFKIENFILRNQIMHL